MEMLEESIPETLAPNRRDNPKVVDLPGHYINFGLIRRITLKLFLKYEGYSKSKIPYFLSFFLGKTEINYQRQNVQEVCATTL